MRKYKEQIMSVIFLIAACASILAVILICAFLIYKWNSYHRENRTWRIYYRKNMDAKG